MHFGHYISGFAHLGLLTGLFIGPVFQKEVDPIEYSNVSLISEQDFIDLTASNISPKVSEETSELTPLNENEDKLNLLINEETKVLKSEGPEVVLDEPLAPVIKQPDLEIAITERPPELSDEINPPFSQTVNTLPDIESETAKITKPSKVQKPVQIPQPETDASQNFENINTVSDGPNILKDKDMAEPNILVSSLRPKTRPRSNFENKSENEMIEAAISDAIQQSSGQSTLGKPLTFSEIEKLKYTIKENWSIDPGSLSQEVKVKIHFSLKRNGTCDRKSIRVSEVIGGNKAAQQVAIRRAKIAVSTCDSKGYKLPPEKYESWRDIEIVFDPTSY
tara:strand:+ start:706 stop:1710 length:1005 start_codon:yes stop_codon:yes gene_type:complete